MKTFLFSWRSLVLALFFSLVSTLGIGQVNIIPIRTDVSGFASWTDTNVAGTTYLQLLTSSSSTVTPAMNFDSFSSETLNFTARTFGGTTPSEILLTVSISIDDGVNWTVLGTRTPSSSSLSAQAPFDLSSYNGTQVKIKFSVGGTNNSIGVGIDDIKISGISASTTTTTSTSALSGFSYVEGSGPSTEQTFNVSGSNLSSDITITPPSNWEISTTSGSGFSNSAIVLIQNSGSVPTTTIYTRLISGLSVNSYSGNITVSTNGTSDKTIMLSGNVTNPPQTPDWANFQGLSSSTIVETGSTDAYARVYEPGLTPGAGAGTGINAWIGYSTTNAATEADFANASWTWVSAGYFGESGNNDEYKATLSGLVPGTYYIVSRFQLGGAGSTEPYKYGGNGNNFWSSPSSSTVLTVNSDIVDWANIQYPLNATLTQGSDITIYARVYEPGITNSVGQGSGINAWIGYSTSNNNPNSASGWTWLPATFHGDANGLNSNDNDEYKIDLGASLSPGTYYYASRFQKNGSPSYVYGGTGGIWNNDNGTLTISALDAPVAIAATNIASNSFTANWNSVSGATSYILEVLDGPVASDLIISEYIEGSSNNKYIELYNGTGSTINLANYSLQMFSNGASTPTNNNLLSGTLDNNSTIVYKNSSASLYSGSATTISATNYNGDDAVALVKGTTYVDIFGKIGEDPGTAWTSTNNSTLDKTLVRKPTILTGVVTNPASGFPTLESEWTSYPIDNVSNLGSHTMNVGNIISTQNVGNVTSFTVSSLNPLTTYYYRVRAINGSTISGNSNVISATTQMAETVWAGSPAAWSNGTPNSTTNAIINADYNDVSFTANNITINNGRTLTIGNGNSVSVSNVINNGNIIVNDGGNFIQSTGSSYTSGAGSTFVVNKNTSSASGKYVFWSAPVQGQNIFDIYGTAGTPQYVMTYNSNTDLYPTVSNPTTAGQGIGYSVKVPSASAQAIFSGIPNNGDIPVTLDAIANTNGNTWNLIGNPYPSNLNLVSLYNGGNNGIASSIYLWDNLSATNTSQQQAATTWAIFNASGSGTWSQTGSLSVSGVSVKPGQGFIVKATSGTTTFTNSMRNGDASSTFVNKNVQNLNEGKYWLTLTTPSGSHYTTAVTYGEGAQNTYDVFDSAMMSVGADAVYSYLNPNKLAIQGRDYFVNTDVVPLGNKQSTSGIYTISLTNKTGVFAGGQDIYLRDKLLNIYTNLQTNAYTYSGVVSEQQDRFEIVYQTQGSLGTSENVKEQIQVYKDENTITISAPEKIETIEVYDSAGRLVKTLFPKLTKTSLQLDVKGVYLLKIKSGSYTLSKKVIF